jgi:hypothetical protein
MTNNKQNSVEWFAQKLYETLEIKGDGYVIDSLLDLAKAMHKEEIINAANKLLYHGTGPGNTAAEQYYNETYGSNETIQ